MTPLLPSFVFLSTAICNAQRKEGLRLERRLGQGSAASKRPLPPSTLAGPIACQHARVSNAERWQGEKVFPRMLSSSHGMEDQKVVQNSDS